MCIKISSDQKITKEEVTVYKIVKISRVPKNEAFYSENYPHSRIPQGPVKEKLEHPLEYTGTLVQYELNIHMVDDEGLGFYVYSNPYQAAYVFNRYYPVTTYTTHTILECIIPKGVKYIEGYTSHMGFRAIITKELIPKKSLNWKEIDSFITDEERLRFVPSTNYQVW